MGHGLAVCKAPKVIRCNQCGTANVRTVDGPCNNRTGQIGTTRVQTLRRVGLHRQFMISIMIMTEVVEGVINTMGRWTTISRELAKLLEIIERSPNGWGIILAPLTLADKEIDYPCKMKYDQEIPLIIGTELLDMIGFTLEIGGCKLNQYSPVFRNPTEIRAMPIREQVGMPPTNPILRAVHEHNTERLRDQIEWETQPTLDELALAVEKMIITD